MSAAAQTSSIVFDGRVPFPEFANIETTMKCNLQCPMCLPYNAGTTVDGWHMDLEAFERIARAVFPYVGQFQLTVSGEPMMSKGLDRMLALAAEYGVQAEYFSNGTLLSDAMIELILPTLGEINISFDGATKETFETLRAGATFDHVVRNVQHLAAALQAIPLESRPVAALNVTLMEKNIRELPAIVELAHGLGLDHVSASHVYVGTKQMEGQSLAHHLSLAREWIDKALERGRELEIPVIVQPLDQVMVAMADAAEVCTISRVLAAGEGGPQGLEGRSVYLERRRLPPPIRVSGAASDRHVEERSRLRARGDELPAAPADDRVLPNEVWFCDFLWNRIYISADGVVQPCCVPGVPELGSFDRAGFADIWDGDEYRAMRLGLVKREPVPFCRGCQHIRRAIGEDAVTRVMGGRPLPAPPVVDAVTVATFGTPIAPVAISSAPILEWPAVDGAVLYAVEGSVRVGDSIDIFDTAARGIRLSEPRFPVPLWLWGLTPVGALVAWRAIARLPEARLVVARGWLVRVDVGEARVGVPGPLSAGPSRLSQGDL